MSTRKYGSIDANTASFVYSSGLSNKIIDFTKFGYNPDVDTIVEEDVWDAGGVYQFLTAPSVMLISSTSADDGVGGTGLSVVSIQGLNNNWDLVSELVTLDGVSQVATANQYIRLFRMTAVSSDTGGDIADAAGAISAVAQDGGALQAQIEAGNTSTKMTMFSIPKGYTGFVSSVWTSGGANDDYVVDLQIRNNGGVFYTAADIEISNSGTFDVRLFPAAGPITEMSDVKFKALAIANNAQVRVGYKITLIRNDYLKSLAESI